MNDIAKENGSHGTGTDILGWVDSLKFGRFHIVLLLLTGLPVLFAGYCTQVIALILPSILKEWGLSPISAGTLISWGFVGFMLGSLFFGAVADHLGRKKMLMAALALCAVSTGLSYYASGFGALCSLRFCTGLGVGGVFPLSVAVISEFAPASLRARLLTVVAGSYTLGWAVAAFVSIILIPAFGWRIMLAVGALPLLCLPFIGLYLPESIHFLFGKTHHVSRFFMSSSADSVLNIAREASRISHIAGATLPAGPVQIPIVSATTTSGRLSSLFRPGLARMTILLSLTYFLCSIVLYGISSWLPTLMVKAGFSLTKSFSYSMVQSIGSCLGGVFLGYLLDIFGRKRGLALTYLLGGMSVLLFSLVTSEASLYIAGAATGIFVLAAPTALLVVIGETFPTNIRSTGVGLVQAMSKIGSILGPVIGGALQAVNLSPKHFFVIFALPCFFCVGLVFFYRTKKKGEALETV
jgi:MFS transporter, AAHS family, benzoate transport protein